MDANEDAAEAKQRLAVFVQNYFLHCLHSCSMDILVRTINRIIDREHQLQRKAKLAKNVSLLTQHERNLRDIPDICINRPKANMKLAHFLKLLETMAQQIYGDTITFTSTEKRKTEHAKPNPNNKSRKKQKQHPRHKGPPPQVIPLTPYRQKIMEQESERLKRAIERTKERRAAARREDNESTTWTAPTPSGPRIDPVQHEDLPEELELPKPSLDKAPGHERYAPLGTFTSRYFALPTFNIMDMYRQKRREPAPVPKEQNPTLSRDEKDELKKRLQQECSRARKCLIDDIERTRYTFLEEMHNTLEKVLTTVREKHDEQLKKQLKRIQRSFYESIARKK